jgi:ATP-dependent DNA ligase
MFAAVCKLGLKGNVGKRATSVYRPGSSKTWIKVKNLKSAAARAGGRVLKSLLFFRQNA